MSNHQPTLDSWVNRGESSSSRRGHGGRGRGNHHGNTTHSERRARLAAVASETRTVLPQILSRLPGIHASKSEVFHLGRVTPLRPESCPKWTASGQTSIQVVNDDTFNAAINLAANNQVKGRVAILNMASYSHPGGGWIRGAMAQEEMLCYRSSLSLSLHQSYYPWSQRMALYTPDVVIIRSDMPSGHTLLVPDVKPDDLPVVSTLSIAALRVPKTKTIQLRNTSGELVKRVEYANSEDRVLTKDKMRLCLRMAAHRGHGSLVLGALGCGAFKNPPEEVTACWLEVLREAEFQGGWWENIVFAVYDTKNDGNFAVFERDLGGVQV